MDEKQPQSLHNIKFQEDETEKAIEFVSKMAVSGDPDEKGTTNIKFQRKLFKSGLEKPENVDGQNPKIIILFDGFDEISQNYKSNTTKLIKVLKGSEVTQLWVTTRVQGKAYLEDQLESPAYILNPLNEQDQKDFLNRLLSELFEKSGEQKNFDTIFQSKNLIESGDKFIEMPVLATDENEQTILHWIVQNGNKDTVINLLNWVKENLEESFPGTLKDLLLKVDKDKKTALQLAVYKDNKDIVDTLLKSVEKKPEILRDMLLRGDKDELNALQLAVYKDNKDIVDTLLKSVEKKSQILKDLLLKVDKDKKNALQLAVYRDNKDIVDALLKSVEKKPEILKDMLLKVDKKRKNALQLAVYKDNKDIVDTLLKSVEKKPEILRDMLLRGDKDES